MTESPRRRGLALVEIIAASVWLGATVLFAGVVAPAAFAALPTRTLAGALVGAVLPALFYAGILLGLLLLITSLSARRGRAVTPAMVGGLLVAVACSVAQFAVAPRIERARAAIGGPVDALSTSDPRRVSFGRLHAASVGWLALGVIGAVTAAAGAAASLRRNS